MSVYDDDLVKSVRLFGQRPVEDFGQFFRTRQRPMAQILEKKKTCPDLATTFKVIGGRERVRHVVLKQDMGTPLMYLEPW